MTKRLIILSATALCFLSAHAAIAAVPEAADSLMKEKMPTITARYQAGKYGKENRLDAPTSFGPGYEVYVIDLAKVRKLRGSDFSKVAIDSVLNPDYTVEYPLLDPAGKVVAAAFLYRKNNVWSFGGRGSRLPLVFVEFSSNRDEIYKWLAGQGINNINSIKHLTTGVDIETPPGGVDFIYVDSAQGKYLMPLNYTVNSLYLQDKKVYPAAEVLSGIAAIRNDPTNEQGFYLGVLDSIQSLMDFLLRDPAAVPPAAANNVMKKEMPSVAYHYKTWNLNSILPAHAGRAYKVYGLNFTKIKNMGPRFGKDAITSIIGSGYVWAYPLLDSKGNFVASAWVTKVRGVWSLVALGNYGQNKPEFSYTGKELNKYLAKKGIVSFQSVKHVTATLGANFFYVETDRGPYLVPIDSASWSTWAWGTEAVPADKALANIYRALLPSKNNGGSSLLDVENQAQQSLAPPRSSGRSNARKSTSGRRVRKSTSRRAGWIAPLVGLIAVSCLSVLALALRRRRRQGAAFL